MPTAMVSQTRKRQKCVFRKAVKHSKKEELSEGTNAV